MKYWQAIKLSSKEFKQLTEVKHQTFRLIVYLVKAQEKHKKKPGCRTKLIIKYQILVTLQYWKEYRRYFHISKDWKIAESTICRIVKKIETKIISNHTIKYFCKSSNNLYYFAINRLFKNKSAFYKYNLDSAEKIQDSAN